MSLRGTKQPQTASELRRTANNDMVTFIYVRLLIAVALTALAVAINS